LLDFVRSDLKDQQFTDLNFRTESGRDFRVHKLVMAAYSPKLMEILKKQVRILEIISKCANKTFFFAFKTSLIINVKKYLFYITLGD
jgi:hypothetical protein